MAKACAQCGAELWDDGSCLSCDWRRVPGQPARPSDAQPKVDSLECPKCGEALWDSGSCPRCDRHTDPTERPQYYDDRPDHWRRLVTSAIASLLGVLALILLADAASCDPDVWFDCTGAEVERYIAYSLLLMAIPFALATVLPFGRLRRVAVAVGSAMLAGALAYAAASVVAYAADMGSESAIALILSAGGIAFCLTLYPAYRLAR